MNDEMRSRAKNWRPHLTDLFPADLLNEMVSGRYVNATQHPTDHLTIWNYGQRAQFDNVWNEVTLTCRGLITDGGGYVLARPFRKFFNLSQLDKVPDGPFVAATKMDGSLGIGYVDSTGFPAIATRGSFTSDQAVWATAWLRERPREMAWVLNLVDLGITPLFEIIYPDNRIVVDYGQRAELVLLGAIDVPSGRDVKLDEDWDWPGAWAQPFDGYTLDEVLAMQEPNAEGFVLRWPCGTRAKVKFEEYVRLHKLLTGVNARTIWDLLRNGQPLDDLLNVVPDEFYEWVHSIVDELTAQFTDIEFDAKETLAYVDRHAERRDQAEFIKRGPYPGVTFAMLDGKDYAAQIWKMLRPEATRPFRCGDE